MKGHLNKLTVIFIIGINVIKIFSGIPWVSVDNIADIGHAKSVNMMVLVLS